ncbi:hypothetical protein B0H10DRAFT_2077309, partial [Mycena sp. CBHHK59/15]
YILQNTTVDVDRANIESPWSIWRLSRWHRQPGCRQQDAGLFQEYRLRLPSQSRNSTGVDCSEVFPGELFYWPTEVKMLAPHPPSGTHHRGTVISVLW